MKVYELAKELGVASKEVIDALGRLGHSVKSHMSKVPEGEIDLLRKQFGDRRSSGERLSKGIKNSGNGLKSDALSSSGGDIADKAQKPRTPVVVGPIEKRPFVLGELAKALKCGVNELIVDLLRQGVVATKNQVLSEDQVSNIVRDRGLELRAPTVTKVASTEMDSLELGEAVERAPVVVVLGHVDHGKTTLLDFIRKARTAVKESGGITQHIGAYEVKLPWIDDERVVFLDTPGHGAFSAMRHRGAGVADIAVLVVAADDGVMPQTVEAIDAANASSTPIVVAINKVDRVDKGRIDVVKQQLAQRGLLLEEWGGDVVCIPISAKDGTGVNDLLEMIVLKSKMLDLRASLDIQARGYILESEMERGRGAVATILLQHGSISLGDHLVAGESVCTITSMIDSHGLLVKSVGPSHPVRVAGFSVPPAPGNLFIKVSKEEYKKARSRSVKRIQVGGVVAPDSQVAIGIIVKADTNSSQEAILGSLNSIAKAKKVGLSFISTGIGPITINDVELASNTGATIIGFGVSFVPGTAAFAKQCGVDVLLYEIIYKLIEGFEELVSQRILLARKGAPVLGEKVGTAQVLKVFKIKGVGVIAGSQVIEGRLVPNSIVVASRDGKEVGRGKVVSLERDRKSVKEVHEGLECGFIVDGISDWKPNDKAEFFLSEE